MRRTTLGNPSLGFNEYSNIPDPGLPTIRIERGLGNWFLSLLLLWLLLLTKPDRGSLNPTGNLGLVPPRINYVKQQ